MRPYIEFKNVVKQFGNFTALDHVSLEIPKGAFVTLLGPSGCGKTTLMRQLAGFSEPESGDVLVDGKRMNGLPPFKRNTPLVFQEYALFPHMTVYENISYGLKLNKTPKEEMDRRVQEMLKMFNLVGLEKRFPKEMSGGQQQRVAFARALVMGQEILLLDEPLSNLDAKLRVDVRTELRQIQQKLGITTIYVTHDQDEALSMSDIIAVMRSGQELPVQLSSGQNLLGETCTGTGGVFRRSQMPAGISECILKRTCDYGTAGNRDFSCVPRHVAADAGTDGRMLLGSAAYF